MLPMQIQLPHKSLAPSLMTKELYADISKNTHHTLATTYLLILYGKECDFLEEYTI